ncbi:MAG: hypothetical protein A2167_00690 [Planctomycetes bacterium RBG_13_46_10]|nr:MAG: hypothetical protein A2167_00690 [Planctomycetes bacterium RBG_13_46_10]
MALLAEELVEEWLNRNGYFTIRGIKLGVHEIDILAIKIVGSTVEARHIEVQASSNPISYLCPLSKRLQKKSGRKPQSTKPRSSKEILESVKEWVEKKYHLKRKQELRQSLYPGEWKYELVLHKVKYADEIEVVKKEGINIFSLDNIIKSMSNTKDTIIQSATGTSLMELVKMGDCNQKI